MAENSQAKEYPTPTERSSSFVPLHNHSSFSLLDGHSLIPDLVDRVKQLGQTAIAVTDHGNLHGIYELYKAAKEANIQPIMGIEAYVAPSPISHKAHEAYFFSSDETKRGDDVSSRGSYTHLLLFAKNNVGLKNLFKLSELSWTEGFYKKNRMSVELFREYHEGLIATTGCPSGELQVLLRLGMKEQAIEYAKMMQDIFGKENYFMEIMDHDMTIDLERKVADDLLEISKLLDIPLLATPDSHYTYPEDASIHEHLLCISTRSKMNVPTSLEEGQGGKTRFAFNGNGYYVPSADEMYAKFPEDKFPGAVTNTKRLAEMCDVTIEPRDDLRPVIELPEGETEGSWLTKEAYAGLKHRLPELAETQEYKDRLQFELEVIVPKNYSGYFLVVSDFIRWAKNQGIPMGPGRGSAAGSLLAYCLDITDADPIRFGLLFERFLNPERESPPDVDVDVNDLDRDRLIAYVKDKYGINQVAQVVTFGKILAKNAVKDTVRILDEPYSLGDQLTKAMPEPVFGKSMPLADMITPGSPRYEEAADFREMVKETNAQHIIDVAKGLEGRTRSTGVHAAAVIISNKPVADAVPIMMRQDDKARITQWDYPTCEELGLIKYDFLGLRNLGIIDNAIKLIKKKQGVELSYLDIVTGPMDDPKTYELLTHGNTMGVFQLDSGGLQSLLKLMKPNAFLDISAALSLYRPGPMGVNAHTDYALRKNGLQEVTPIHPDLEDALRDILDETFGLIVYQEQIQFIARELAGYSLGQADMLRRAMGKKKKYILDAEFKPFSEGMLANGYPMEAIQALWDVMVPFADYAFNKCVSDRTKIRIIGLEEPKTAREILKMHQAGEEIWLESMWADGEVKPHRVRDVVATGVKPVFRVKTQDGRTIEVTADHRLMTTRGYVQVQDMIVGQDELIVADKIITRKQKERARANIRKAHGKPPTAAQINARKKTMSKWNHEGGEARKDLDKRNSDRMKAYQSSLTFEDRSRHQKNINATTDRGERIAKIMRDARSTKYDTDLVFRTQVREHLDKLRKEQKANGQHYGIECIASNGMICDSKNELNMAEYLIELGIEFDMHRPVGRGACDFYFDGIYWEMDGMDRHISYFNRKYGDLPFMVVYPEDFKERIADRLGIDHVRNGDLIVSINPVEKRLATIDIMMEENGPKNYLTWKGIVSHNSHTVAYGLTSYATAYLKANYTAEYMAAVLSSVSDDVDKTAFYLEDCRKNGIRVLPPDISYSQVNYDPLDNQTIMFGLRAIRGIGESVSESIVKYRHADPEDLSSPVVPYKDWNDFISRVPRELVNKRVLEGLTYGGALDNLGLSRRAIIFQLPEFLKEYQKKAKSDDKRAKQPVDLFSLGGLDFDDNTLWKLYPMDEYPRMEKLKLEREALGLYVSDHPINGLNIENMASTTISNILTGVTKPLEGWPGPRDVPVRIAGVLTSLQVKRTKKGDAMAIARLEDRSGSIEAPIFPKTYQRIGEFLKVDNVYQFVGYPQRRDEDINFMVDNVRPLDFSDSGNLSVRIKLTESQWARGEQALRSLMLAHKVPVGEVGDDVVISLKGEEGVVKELILDTKVKRSPALLQQIQSTFGSLSIGRWLTTKKPIVTDETPEAENTAKPIPAEPSGEVADDGLLGGL